MRTDDSQTSIIRISFEAKAAGRICRITSTISYCIRRRRERWRGCRKRRSCNNYCTPHAFNWNLEEPERQVDTRCIQHTIMLGTVVRSIERLYSLSLKHTHRDTCINRHTKTAVAPLAVSVLLLPLWNSYCTWGCAHEHMRASVRRH
jgi:hypothetical protein